MIKSQELYICDANFRCRTCSSALKHNIYLPSSTPKKSSLSCKYFNMRIKNKSSTNNISLLLYIVWINMKPLAVRIHKSFLGGKKGRIIKEDETQKMKVFFPQLCQCVSVPREHCCKNNFIKIFILCTDSTLCVSITHSPKCDQACLFFLL